MHAILTLLERENGLIARFLDVLKEEQHSLQSVAPDALSDIVTRKLPLIEALNSIERERAALIGAGTDPTSRAQMHSWIEKQPQAADIAALWQITLQRAQEAKALHLENQAMLNQRIASTEAALDILMQRKNDAAVYGCDGQTSAASGSRIVDSA